MVENKLEGGLIFLTEDLGHPFCLLGIGIVITESLEVVGHIEEHLRLNLHRLDVSHVQQPVTISSSIISFQQLLIHQHRSCCSYP